MFIIKVTSQFEELWRYNLAVMCAGYNHSAEQLFVVSEQSRVAEMGEGITSKPADYPLNRELELHTPAANTLQVLVYVVPHALPKTIYIDDARPFELQIEISSHGEKLYSSKERINQWSGASLLIDI